MGQVALGTERQHGLENGAQPEAPPGAFLFPSVLPLARLPGRTAHLPHCTAFLGFKSASTINHRFLETVPYSSLFPRT